MRVLRTCTFTIICEGKTTDIQHSIVDYHAKRKQWPRTIVVDIPRAQKVVNYIGIEKCKDLLFHSGKYEGAMVSQEGANVIIFSNRPPDMRPDIMSLDRWCVYQIPIPNDYKIPIITYLDWDDVIAPVKSQIPNLVQPDTQEISEVEEISDNSGLFQIF